MPAFNNLAVSLRHLGELGEAADLLRRATALEPTYDMAFTNLGVVHQLQERSDAAEALHRYRQALQEREGADADLRAEAERRLLSLPGQVRR